MVCSIPFNSQNVAAAAKVNSKALLTKTFQNPHGIQLATGLFSVDMEPTYWDERHALGRLLV